jgi:hypothetical protein
MVREVWEETERVRDDCILRIFQARERNGSEWETEGGERSEGLKYSWVLESEREGFDKSVKSLVERGGDIKAGQLNHSLLFFFRLFY